MQPEVPLTATDNPPRPPHGGRPKDLLRFLPDVVKLLTAVARDPRVPWFAKATAGAAVAYVVSPLDVIPDVLPGVGRIDDAFVVVRAVRYLFREAGYEILQDLWPGTEEGFALLLFVAGVKD